MKPLVAFAEKQLGVELWPGQVEVLKSAVASGKRKWVLCLGRRSGKSLLAAIVAVYNACIEDYSGLLRAGETRFIIVVATRQQQAEEFVRVAKELLRSAPDQN